MVRNLKDKVIDLVATICMAILIYLDDIIETIVTCLISVVVCLILVNYLFMPVRVDGTSMYPQLKNNQIGFASIIGKNTKGIERFDIVVIYVEQKNENLVKRVIGLPGEKISFVGDTLYVNDVAVAQDFLDQQYVDEQTAISYTGLFTNDFEVQLNEDEYFCLGDNRLVSLDSRYYGPFSLEQIKAKSIFVIYPFEDFGKAK